MPADWPRSLAGRSLAHHDEEATMEEGSAPVPAEGILRAIELAATGIEVLAVAIIVIAIVVASAVYLSRIASRQVEVTTYKEYRHRVARALLLGLEVLVAADVIRTVALEPTLQNVLILALLVVVRTFLGWSLVVEIEQRWPWQPEEAQAPARDAAETWTPNDRHVEATI
jgi:uncharacterized membrane protein